MKNELDILIVKFETSMEEDYTKMLNEIKKDLISPNHINFLCNEFIF